MRQTYIPDSDRVWTQHYLRQSGAGFVGIPYQRGSGLGSFFRGIFRALMPIVKSAGKSIGKQALTAGANIASDVVAGKTIKGAVNRHGRKGAEALLKKAAAELAKQEGTGKRKRITKRKKPATRRKATKPAKKQRFEDQLGLYYK